MVFLNSYKDHCGEKTTFNMIQIGFYLRKNNKTKTVGDYDTPQPSFRTNFKKLYYSHQNNMFFNS